MKKCIVKNCEKMTIFGTDDVCSECLEILKSEGIQKDLKQFRVEHGECDQEILSAVVYPRIYASRIFWHGLVSLPAQAGQPLFNEISGKNKREVVINLNMALGAYIDRLIALRKKIDVASETL